MVVSSETPRQSFTTSCQRCGSSAWTFFSRSLMTCSSWLLGRRVHPIAAVFELIAFVDEQRGVAAVVDDQAAGPCRRDGSAPGRCTTSNLRAISPFQANTGTPAAAMRGGGVVLRGEDVAARPAHRSRPDRPASR